MTAPADPAPSAPTPHGYETRFARFLESLAGDEGLPRADLHRSLGAHPESVVIFLMVSYEVGGRAGFADAFRLVDLLENLGCRDLAISEPERTEPVQLRVRRPDGGTATVTVARPTLSLGRDGLVRILKQQLAIDRPTVETSVIRPRPPTPNTTEARAGESPKASATASAPPPSLGPESP